jgi:hypothetical protein
VAEGHWRRNTQRVPRSSTSGHCRCPRVLDGELEGASSAIKWSHPTWSIGRAPICYLRTASKHVTFGLWRGVSIDDPSGRLETSGEVMAHAKLRRLEDVDRALFADWLRQARELELKAAGQPAGR